MEICSPLTYYPWASAAAWPPKDGFPTEFNEWKEATRSVLKASQVKCLTSVNIKKKEEEALTS